VGVGVRGSQDIILFLYCSWFPVVGMNFTLDGDKFNESCDI